MSDHQTAAPLLEIRHVSISYYENEVVHDVSLCVNEGEIFGIAGESGSGKSTLLRACLGLLGKGGLVNRGDIYFKGFNVTNLPEKELTKIRGREIGMVFQNTEASLCPVRTIEKQLYESIPDLNGTARDEVRKKAEILLKKMDLPDSGRILKSYPFELSGGMNQRVGIMLSMIQKPALLLADEPTSALDVTIQKQIAEELMNLRKEFGVTILLVSHNMGLLRFMADSIAIMKDGRIVESGPKEKIFHAPEAGYTRELISAVPTL